MKQCVLQENVVFYYKINDGWKFFGTNVDTGNFVINMRISQDYYIYSFIYDSIKDRFIGMTFSSTVVNNA